MSGRDSVIGPRVRAVENMVARAREKTGITAGGPACVNCRMTLWVSFFFDGTGNHRENDFPNNHSNVAALFDSHINDRNGAIIPFYYEGIGTPFEFKDRHERVPVPSRTGMSINWVDKEGYREGESSWNKGFGGGLENRLEKAVFDLQSAIDFQKSKTRVDAINLSAFGFSRGATEARAFMHWLANHSKIKVRGHDLSYDGIPLNVKFLGLFDTVESVGGAGTNKRPKLVKLSIPDFVQKCAHIVAAHELRGAFPLTGLGTNRYTQIVQPGAHADIGGGYADNEQGRSDKLARTGLLQMLDHARGAGLQMHSLSEMEASQQWTRRYKPSFDVSTTHRDALSAYMQHVKKKSGTLQEVFASHMELYWSWIDSGLAMEDIEMKRNALPNGHRNPADKSLRTMAHLLRYQARTKAGRGAQKFPPQGGVVPAPVEAFFEKYIHDSFEHFSMTGGTMMTDLSTADYYEIRKVHSPRT
ncbi:T6SS phospholipase effector Tle1-like catalytic domain-containing protein [Luteimonas sp. A501]